MKSWLPILLTAFSAFVLVGAVFSQKPFRALKTSSVSPRFDVDTPTAGLNTAACIQEVINKEWLALDELAPEAWDREEYVANRKDLLPELPPMFRPHLVSTETPPAALFIPAGVSAPHTMKTNGEGRLFVGYELLPSGSLSVGNGMQTPQLPPKTLDPLSSPQIFEEANALLRHIKTLMATQRLFFEAGPHAYRLSLITITPPKSRKDFMFIVGHETEHKTGPVFLAHVLLAHWPTLPKKLHTKAIKFYTKKPHLSGLITLKKSCNDAVLDFMRRKVKSTQLLAPEEREIVNLVQSSRASGRGRSQPQRAQKDGYTG